jgi:DNA-damage-inducible protein J
MGQSILSVRIDENMKRRFEAFCADAGMNPSVAVNLFVRAVMREKKIPFEIVGNDDPFYSEKTRRRMNQAMDRLEAGLGVEHELIEVEE